MLHFNGQDEKVNEYQATVIADYDPTLLDLPDYKAAYRKLNQERNKPWKLNPSDIADFYLLEPFLQSMEGRREYREDDTNMAYLNAKDRMHDIGTRLLVAMTYEQLDEFDRFAPTNPDALPTEVREKIDEFYQANAQGMRPQSENTPTGRMHYYLSTFKRKLDEHSVSRSSVTDPFEDPEMFGTTLAILESQQSGRWKTMASAMRALHDPEVPVDGFIDTFLPEGLIGDQRAAAIAAIEKRREPFLIDRLINYVHNTGLMSARVTNYFPKSASLLIAHGLPQHEGYLFYNSSFNWSTDSLAQHIRRSLPKEQDRDIVEDIVELVKNETLPREFAYGLLLEFPQEQVQEAVTQKHVMDNLSPGRVYNLLQRVSHHDGTSSGKLKMAA